MPRRTLAQVLEVDQVDVDCYVSKHNPVQVGNLRPVAYGGFVIGIAVQAACLAVKSGLNIYSCLGSFLGATKVDRKVIVRVLRTRDTKAFATRRVIVFQKQDDGSERSCAELICDFHVDEPALFEYSAPPIYKYATDPTDPVRTATAPERRAQLLRSGVITEKQAAAHEDVFGIVDEFGEVRWCMNGFAGTVLSGIAPKEPTDQDHLPITDRTAAEWLRSKDKDFPTVASRAAALAFVMDQALSFVPLDMLHLHPATASVYTTLDISLRFLRPPAALTDWHFRERRTIVAAGARAQNEGRLWDRQGNIVAIMNQTAMIRPRKGQGVIRKEGAKL